MNVLDWIFTNWENILFIISSIIAIASVIVKFTPTLKDDVILLKVVKFLSKYIALNRDVDDDKIRKQLKKGGLI